MASSITYKEYMIPRNRSIDITNNTDISHSIENSQQPAQTQEKYILQNIRRRILDLVALSSPHHFLTNRVSLSVQPFSSVTFKLYTASSFTYTFPLLRRRVLGHSVKSAAILEPFNLPLVKSVCKLSLPRSSVLGVHLQRHWLANGELGAHEVNFVVRIDLIVIGRVGESERKHSLLLQVGLVLYIASATRSEHRRRR